MTRSLRNTFIGASVERREDLRFLRGRGIYVDDLQVPGLLYAVILRSSVAHGRLRSVDVSGALKIAGVHAVITAKDMTSKDYPSGVPIVPMRLQPLPEFQPYEQPVIAYQKVRYVGEPIAVIVATDPYLAEDAADQVWAELEELPVQLDPMPSGPGGILHELVPDNVVGGFDISNGEDVDDLFTQADVVIQERFSIHRHSASPMEPRGLVAEADSDSGRLTVWGPTKVKHFNKKVLAALLDLPADRILLIEPDVGGGFGPRGEFYPEDFLIPWLALHLQLPVKWVEDRYENFVALNHSREHVIDLAVAARSDGSLLGFRSTDWCSIGAYLLAPFLHATSVPQTLQGNRGLRDFGGPRSRWRRVLVC